MAFGEMNSALAAKGIKQGDVGRNQRVNGRYRNGRDTMRTNIEIRRALYSGLAKLYPDDSSRTYWDVAIDSLLEKFARGERWSCHFVCDRLFGRVPYNVSLDVTQHQAPLTNLTMAELRERFEQVRAKLLADAIDAAPVNPTPDTRANPGRELTLAQENAVPAGGTVETT